MKKKQKTLFNLIRIARRDELLDIRVNTKRKIGQVLKQFEKKFENCKVTCKGSVIHKEIHYVAKWKFLDTNFKAQNILLNLMKKTLHFFVLVDLFKNDQTESIKN